MRSRPSTCVAAVSSSTLEFEVELRRSFMPEKKIGVGVMINASVPHQVGILLSNYVYDRPLGRPDIDKLYADARLAADAEEGNRRMVAEVEKRSKRPWMLKNPNETYVGRYENPLY